MQTYTEQRFEDHIEQHLNRSDYRSLQSADYDRSLCLIPNETLQFIQDTQPSVYQRLERQYGADTSDAWLAHLLTHLYRSPTDTHRIFDSIIVVTNRRILDKQLQDTIKQVEQVDGVVQPVEATSAQLRGYLESGKDVIISTIQEFSVIAENICRSGATPKQKHCRGVGPRFGDRSYRSAVS